jgi:hemolysin III
VGVRCLDLHGTALVLSAPSSRARLAAAIDAGSVAALFASSALYHRVRWRSPAARRWMRRLDHSMIFVVIAGTYTPFALIALRGALAGALLVAAWAGAAAGIVLTLAWIDAPEWLVALLYALLGWVGAVALPTLIATLGAAPAALVAAGGVLYTAGAVVYAASARTPSRPSSATTRSSTPWRSPRLRCSTPRSRSSCCPARTSDRTRAARRVRPRRARRASGRA